MFIALYHWKVKKGHEATFQEGWRLRTIEIYEHLGSLGSRLHRAEDGTWYGYAQWPDKATWEAAWETPSADSEARAMMRDSIEESLPDVYMTVAEDLLRSDTAS